MNVMASHRAPERRRPGYRSALGAATGLIVAGALVWCSGHSARAEAGDEVFAETNVFQIQIEIPSQGIDHLRSGGWSWRWAQGNRERPEVKAVIREAGRVYTNVAVHLKGAAGSFQPVDSKPSFTMNFDKFVKGQSFHGLHKISLNNSVQDPSFLSEKICRELFNAAGVPAPRAEYATVELNGRKLGLYVLLEGYNKQFLKRHFKNAKGVLYDGGFLHDIDAPAAADADSEAPEGAGLSALVEAAGEPDDATRMGLLHKALDWDRFITFMAMEIMVCHWDGYCMNRNNFRIYLEPESKQMVFMPHGMDQMFGVMIVQPNMGVLPKFQGLVARAVMAAPEGRRAYLERLRQLNESFLNVDRLTNRVYKIAARLTPVLAAINSSYATNYAAAVDDFAARIASRKDSLEEQLSGVRGKIIDFDTDGVAPLSGWTTLTNAGTPLMAEAATPDGRKILQIKAEQGTSVASWRTKVLLEEGHYSFTGKMQTKGVSADPRDLRGGAGLRVSERSAVPKTLGNSDWREVTFDFEVPSGLQDVDLVCELRASKGEVLFDADSLRLVRK
ncbi:MAG: CotH kinase family protein [Verrucomicrobiota bacterium]